MRTRLQQGSALRRPLAAAAIVVAAAALAAVTLGEARHAEAAGLPACARPHAAVTVPAGLATFPLPRGTVLDSRVAKYGYVIVSGHVPGYINPARDFFVSRLPGAGYRLGAGDAEAAEVETGFSGHGGFGRLKLREIAGCPGALSLQLAFRSR
jgi:hypothetical protein